MLQFPSRDRSTYGMFRIGGLEDVFLEAGVFGPNAVTKVMDGKAVRGLMLAYEAIWRFKLRYLSHWLESKEEEIPELEHEVKEL